MNTFAIIVFTGILGALLLRKQGSAVMKEAQAKMGQNQIPADALVKGLFTFLGGVLLLTPGFLTDALGFSLVFPGTQFLWRRFFGSRIQNGISTNGVHVFSGRGGFGRPPRHRADQAREHRGAGTAKSVSGDVIDIQVKSKSEQKIDND